MIHSSQPVHDAHEIELKTLRLHREIECDRLERLKKVLQTKIESQQVQSALAPWGETNS
jgi:hypothetical protein